MKKILLIGYRATGKTSLGRFLAEQLGGLFVDTDLKIEEKLGKTIARLFAEEGEPFFRDQEAEVVWEVLRETAFSVVATGGGVPLREDSRMRLRESGVVFWLKASPKTILARMAADQTSVTRRPSLTNLSPEKEIEIVLRERMPFYSQCAHYSLDTEDRSLDEIAEELLVLYRSKGGFQEEGAVGQS